MKDIRQSIPDDRVRNDCVTGKKECKPNVGKIPYKKSPNEYKGSSSDFDNIPLMFCKQDPVWSKFNAPEPE